jgi:TonB-linked SusC/RagA family outer membrane protein
MKNILLQLVKARRFMVYVFLLQILTLSPSMANDSNVHNVRSVKDVWLHISFENENVINVFEKIESLTEFTFAYNVSDLKKTAPVSGSYSNKSLYEILTDIARQTGIGFKQVDGNINAALKKERPSKEAPEISIEITVTGKVSADDGEPLPGVNVIVKGTSIGTVTDMNGNYSIQVPNEDDILVFSFIGYMSEEIPVNGRSTIEVTLVQDAQSLDEVVVIGYGTTRKESLTGSVGTVEGEALENIPAPRVDQILQGRVSGVHVTQVNGSPGAQSTIRIRGGNSIQGNNDPLFVIDGFIAGTNFNLNNLNTNDIKSIDILKDATAIAIYGTRGANGVILITTKTGRSIEPGKPRVSFNTYHGQQYMMNTVDFLNGPQQAAYANEDAEFRGASLPFVDPDNVPDVNWLDQITRNAPISNVDVSVSGQSSDRKIRYYVSGNYFNQQGIIRGSGIEKYLFRSNMDFEVSDKVRMGFKLNISRLIREQNKVNLSAALYRSGLPTRAIYDEQGNFTAINPVSASISRNPEADIQLKVDHNLITNMFGNFYVEAEPIKDVVIRSSFGPEINYNKDNRYNPAILPENLIVQQGGDGSVGVSTSINLLNENTISFSKDFGDDHQVDLLGGFTWQTFRAEGNFAQGFAFPNDALQYNNLANGSDPTRNVIGSNWNSFQLVSWLGRAHYEFKNRYLFTAVGRVDGSSRFAGSNNEYGFFPSAAVAWRLDQEPFIKELDVFDILKLRTSYGKSGSQAIESFRSLAVLQGVSAYFNDIEQTGVQNGRPANQDLKWETTKQLDIGLEAAFFDDRLTVEVDYYNKKTEDLLLNVQIPRQTGFDSKLQNIGSIRNRGLELKITTLNVSASDFRWSSMLMLSGNRNEVLDLAGVEFIDIASPTSGGPAGRLIVGQPAPVFVGVEYLGTWKSQDEIDAAEQVGNNVVGGPRYRDTNDDGNISVEDFEVLGSPQPDFLGGIQNTFAWKNISLDVFIQGTYGNEIFNSLTQSAFFGRPEANKYAETLNRWTPENPDSDIPRAGAVATLADVKNNSRMVEDGSHLRLKSLRLNYNFPVRKLGWNMFENLSMYFSGTNLLLLSNFQLFDPETSSYGNSNLAAGFSSGEYPYGRTLTLGVKATF